jgi:hypothetical protein
MKKPHGGYKSDGFTLPAHTVGMGLHVGGCFYNIDGGLLF